MYAFELMEHTVASRLAARWSPSRDVATGLQRLRVEIRDGGGGLAGAPNNTPPLITPPGPRPCTWGPGVAPSPHQRGTCPARRHGMGGHGGTVCCDGGAATPPLLLPHLGALLFLNAICRVARNDCWCASVCNYVSEINHPRSVYVSEGRL